MKNRKKKYSIPLPFTRRKKNINLEICFLQFLKSARQKYVDTL